VAASSKNCTAIALASSLQCLSVLHGCVMYNQGVTYDPQIDVTMLCCDSYVLICSPSRIFAVEKTESTAVAATQSIFFK